MRRPYIYGIVGIVVIIAIAGGIAMYQKGPEATTGVPKTWDEVRTIVLPQLVQTSAAETFTIASVRLFPDVSMAYAIPQKKGGYILASANERKGWNVGDDVLNKQAMANLEHRAKSSDLTVSQVNVNGDSKYITVETQDGFAAARLTLESVRNRVKKELGEPFIVGIPSRDFLIFWPENFGAAKKFADEVKKVFDGDHEFGLTPHLLRFSAGKIEVSNDKPSK